MADRYKKLQMMRQQQQIETKLSELTQEPSQSSSGSNSRTAHVPSTSQTPAVMNKAKQQLLAREKAREFLAR